MATQAKQFDIILSGKWNSSGVPASNGTATIYDTGTSTLSTVWADADKVATKTNPVALDERGVATVFGDGNYDVVFKDSSGSAIGSTFTKLNYEVPSQDTTFGARALDYGSTQNAATINAAITAAAGNPTNIILDSGEWDIDANVTVPTNVNIQYVYGAYATIQSGVTLTYNGTWSADLYQIHRGAGTLTYDDRNNDIPSIHTLNGAHDDRTLTGALTITGDITQTGNNTITGNGTIVGDTLTRGSTAATNTVDYPLKVSHITSGTPATGIGVGIEFETETSASNNEIGSVIESVSTDVTGTSEDFDLVIKTMSAGSAASEAIRFKSSKESSLSGYLLKTVTSGITASTTQTQGQGALTSDVNEVSTCANDNDTVTLPTAQSGMEVTVINNGAERLQIFPASSDNLGAGVDTATSVAPGVTVTFKSYDATNWERVSVSSSGFISYTPTIVGMGTVSSNTAYYRLDGDLMTIHGGFTAGTTTAVEVQIPLPSGYTVSTNYASTATKVGEFIGDETQGNDQILLATSGDSFFNIGIRESGVRNPLDPTIGTAFSSSLEYRYQATVNIA